MIYQPLFLYKGCLIIMALCILRSKKLWVVEIEGIMQVSERERINWNSQIDFNVKNTVFLCSRVEL